MTLKQSNDLNSDFICITHGKYKSCKKCEIKLTVTCGNINELFKVVVDNKNNTILKCILDHIDPYLCKSKYDIEVFKIHKKYVLLKQSHLDYSTTFKSLKINSFHYVKIL